MHFQTGWILAHLVVFCLLKLEHDESLKQVELLFKRDIEYQTFVHIVSLNSMTPMHHRSFRNQLRNKTQNFCITLVENLWTKRTSVVC